MPFVTLRDVALHKTPPGADARLHPAGTVLSDYEVPEFIRQKVAAGDAHYALLLRRVSNDEAFRIRASKTSGEGNRRIDRRHVSPPWDDYVDLRPEEIIARLRDADPAKVAQAQAYERAGLNRDEIVGWDPARDAAVGRP